MKSIAWLLTPLILAFAACFSSPLLAWSDDHPESFLPTWKLLSPQEKRQFIAGYLFGLRDAAKITDVAIEYGKDNPGKATEALQKIRGLYTLSEARPDLVAQKVDQFFADPANQDAPLSLAINAARDKLR